MRLVLACLLTLALVGSAAAQAIVPGGGGPVVTPSQGGINLNGSQNSAVATANTKTLAGVAGQRIRLYGLTANCSAGTATLSITDGGTTVLQYQGSPVPAAPSVLSVSYDYVPYTTTATGNSIVITVGSCGGGNTSSLNWQADQY